MRLDHITVRTDDLDAVRDFFTDVIGLEEGERPPFKFPGYWLYGGGRPIVHLMQGAGGTGDGRDQDTRGDTGALDHIAFFGNDHDALIGRLTGRGLEFTERTQSGTGTRQVFVTGPHGLVVEIDFAPDG